MTIEDGLVGGRLATPGVAPRGLLLVGLAAEDEAEFVAAGWRIVATAGPEVALVVASDGGPDAPRWPGVPALVVVTSLRSRLRHLRAGATEVLGATTPRHLVDRATAMVGGRTARGGLPVALVVGSSAHSAGRVRLLQALDAEGFEALSVAPRESAIWAAAARQPDGVVVLDVEAIALVREELPATPCLYVGPEQARALLAGADRCASTRAAASELGALVGACPRAPRRAPISRRVIVVSPRGEELGAFTDTLATHGFDVAWTGSPAEAAELVPLQPVDAVVVAVEPSPADVELRRACGRAGLPVVAWPGEAREAPPGPGGSRATLLEAMLRAAVRRARREREGRRAHDDALRAELAATEFGSLRTLAEARGKLLAEVERKNAELARVGDELRMLSVAVDESPVGVLITDREGQIEYTNHKLQELVGLGREDFAGRTPHLLLGAPESPSARVYLRSLASGQEWRGELLLRDARGRELWALVSRSPVYEPGGGPMRQVHTFVDITQRREAESVLAASEERLALILETIAEGIVVLAPSGRVVFHNKAAERIFGAAALAAPSFHDADLAVNRVIASRRTLSGLELEFVRVSDGKRRAITVNAAPLKSAVGEVTAVLLSVVDVTARKESEALLKAADARYRALVERLPAIAFSCAPGGALSYVSPQIEALLGLSPSACLGDPTFWTRLVHPDDHDRVMRELPTGSEFRCQLPDGRVLWLRAQCTVVADTDGAAVQIDGILFDIDELVRAKSQAEQAAAAKSRFLSSMSHELRTPLNAILGFSRVLERGARGALDGRQLVYLRDIQQAGEHMLQLVDDLLDLQRASEGRDLIVAEPHAIAPIVEEATRMVRPLAAEKRHTLLVTLPETLPAARVDRRALLQILVNLLTNAVKYTPAGGSIHVHAAAGGDDVVVSVQDDGIGIAPEDHARIFEYFEQVGGAQGGSGIGLALTKMLVERLGGKIWVQSAVGEGSTFHFTVPRADGAAERAP
jgi:PAS domain S-box-containing protein